MDQNTVTNAIEKQMDSLESTFNWILLLTIPVFWAGLKNQPDIQVLNTTFNLTQTFYVLAIAYFFATLNVYLRFRRIGDYINLVDNQNSLAGISIILLHKWALNPFLYSGDKMINRLHNFYGYGGLIVAWWLGYSALYTLQGSQSNYANILFFALFLILGLMSIQAINRVLILILRKLKQIDSSLYEKYKITSIERRIGYIAGPIVGGLIFITTQYLSRFLSSH